MFIMAVFGVSEFKDCQEDWMEYYKILLVDDELEIRDGMIQKLDWHQLLKRRTRSSRMSS